MLDTLLYLFGEILVIEEKLSRYTVLAILLGLFSVVSQFYQSEKADTIFS